MKHRIILDVELAELSDEERASIAEMCKLESADGEEEELPTAAGIETWELADLIAGYLSNDDGELWAGSEMYARIVSVEVA